MTTINLERRTCESDVFLEGKCIYCVGIPHTTNVEITAETVSRRNLQQSGEVVDAFKPVQIEITEFKKKNSN